MVVARFCFKPEYAHMFIDNGEQGQTITEVTFDDPMELVEVCRDFEPYLQNCTALVDGKIIDLRAASGL